MLDKIIHLLQVNIIIFTLIFATNAFASDYTEPLTGMEFVEIKGGKFVMGDIQHKDPDASPPHRVTVNDFWIGKYEVTFDQYDVFCKATKRKMPDDNGWGRGNRPVINVSWEDAVAFTEWLSEKSGKNISLPSEAQWEYAARAGTSSRFWWGNHEAVGMANCNGCGSQWDKLSSAPVGSFRANPWGLHDMTGNVYEWCLDTYHDGYKGAPADGSNWLGGDDSKRITRGGGWIYPANEMAAHVRNWYGTKEKYNYVGMRLVMQATP